MPHRLTLALKLLAMVGIVWFALQGGEYSTLDLIRQHRETEHVTRAIDSLSHLADSLGRYERRLEHDPRLQERVAREQFGMIKEHELLYRLVDSTADIGTDSSGNP